MMKSYCFKRKHSLVLYEKNYRRFRFGKIPKGNSHEILRAPAEDFPNMELQMMELTNQEARKWRHENAPSSNSNSLRHHNSSLLGSARLLESARKNSVAKFRNFSKFLLFIVLSDFPRTYLLFVDVKYHRLLLKLYEMMK